MSITTADIHAAADAIAARGKKPTVTGVRTELGSGSFSTISEALKSWKEQKAQETKASTTPDKVTQRATELATQVWLIAQEEAEQRMEVERGQAEKQKQELEASRTEALETADAALAEQEALQKQLENTKAERDLAQQKVAVLQAQLEDAVARAERAEAQAGAAREAETTAREAAALLAGKLEAIETKNKTDTIKQQNTLDLLDVSAP